MGFNLRRSKKIAPGVRINLSNKGLGVSVGPAHSKLSVSPEMRITGNIGIPETGVRYTKVIKKGNQMNSAKQSTGGHSDGEMLETSRFNRDPIDKGEWVQTSADYKHEIWFLSSVKARKRDNSVAPEFLTQKEEVVFAKTSSLLVDVIKDHFLDSGSVYITNKRVAFKGKKKSVEWNFERMSIFLPYDDEERMLFQNSDHQELQGVQIVNDDWMRFQYFLMRAFMLDKSDLNETLARCSEEAFKYSQTEPT